MATIISRRGFVQGAALAGAGAAAAGALTGVAGTALAENAADPARGDFPWGNTAPEIADVDVEETIEVEVVVAGVGLAGGAAVLAAAEEGAASIAYFDKTEAGYSATGNQTAVINGIQENWGRAGVYDIPEICIHEINEGCGWPKHGIWFKWANGIGETFDWALSVFDDVQICADSSVDTMSMEGAFVAPMAYPLPDGFDPTKEQNVTYATSVMWSSNLFVPAALEKAATLCDCKGYAAHRVEELIMEGGRCVGCYAYNYGTGKYKKVLASKGVILSCGDFGGNEEMIKYYCPAVYDNGIQLMYGTVDPDMVVANQGEAIKMGTWAGARVQQHHAPMIHHMGHSMTGSMMGGMGISPFFRINKLGKRFMNEDTPGQQTENQIELQKDFGCYMIWDAKWPEQLSSFAPTHGAVYRFLEEGETGEGKSLADMEAAVADGSVFMADTIDDLLDQLDAKYGLDVETAKASIERYNELAHNGYDEDFGKIASRLFPIENPPFYASTLGLATMLVIASGLESDEEAHTYDQNRDPIPGLYVAGNAQGDRFPVQYPIAMEGVATSMAIFYGRVAGQNVVKDV